ncbi:MAG: hypothetical protein UU16_C0046G0018 [Candidatus Woesebacteria bacterium GW2011_GWA2_40_7]|uniref:Uncharacterized protein n=1 Tax=Candidatus Woesebacteria bacterium GW2011_GWA2_40_7 TaxID=1618562 RepID=A0A0G0T535_9BACT|nr:MAG: hypothetical protein UU16_C0046G0018 [Candidatus Woesebacteria bacterium GW2011_GWA2_40_7]
MYVMTLTKSDFEAFKELIKVTLEEQTETFLATKEDIKHLPTKDEFYSKMDEIMGELKATREEVVMFSDLNRKVNDHDERIEKIENNCVILFLFT